MKSNAASRIDYEPEVLSAIGFTHSTSILASCLKYGGPKVQFCTLYLASAKTQIEKHPGGFLPAREAKWSPFSIPDVRGSDSLRSEIEHK
jgi:hypothetical protein